MKILVIEARYYESISEDLLQGALAQLQAADAEVVKVNVPGALGRICAGANGPRC